MVLAAAAIFGDVLTQARVIERFGRLWSGSPRLSALMACLAFGLTTAGSHPVSL